MNTWRCSSEHLLHHRSSHCQFHLSTGLCLISIQFHVTFPPLNHVYYDLLRILAAYDFGATSQTSLDLSVWYNGTFNNQSSYNPPNIIRVARSLNMVSLITKLSIGLHSIGRRLCISCIFFLLEPSEADPQNCDHICLFLKSIVNATSPYADGFLILVVNAQAAEAFLRFLTGPTAQLPLLFIKDMPKASSKLRLDFSSLLGPLFYMWILGFLFPVSESKLLDHVSSDSLFFFFFFFLLESIQ